MASVGVTFRATVFICSRASSRSSSGSRNRSRRTRTTSSMIGSDVASPISPTAAISIRRRGFPGNRNAEIQIFESAVAETTLAATQCGLAHFLHNAGNVLLADAELARLLFSMRVELLPALSTQILLDSFLHQLFRRARFGGGPLLHLGHQGFRHPDRNVRHRHPLIYLCSGSFYPHIFRMSIIQ